MYQKQNQKPTKNETKIAIHAAFINRIDMMKLNNGTIPYGEATASSKRLIKAGHHITPSALSKQCHNRFKKKEKKILKKAMLSSACKKKEEKAQEKEIYNVDEINKATEKKKRDAIPKQKKKKKPSTKKNIPTSQ